MRGEGHRRNKTRPHPSLGIGLAIILPRHNKVRRSGWYGLCEHIHPI